MPAEHRYMQDWTPSRFLDWATSIGPETKTQINSMLLSRKYPEQAYRACLGLLHLSKKFSAARLEAACKKANAHGIISMRSIKSMLTTGSDKLDDKQASLVINHSNIRGDTQFH